MDALAREPMALEMIHKPVMKEPASKELVDEPTELQRSSNNNPTVDKELLEIKTSGSLDMGSAKKDTTTFLKEVDKDVAIVEAPSYGLGK